jgi:hypothetical protein
MRAIRFHGLARLPSFAVRATIAWLLLACGCSSAHQLRADLRGALERENRRSRRDHDSLREISIKGSRQTAFGIGASAGSRLGGGPGIVLEWSSED